MPATAPAQQFCSPAYLDQKVFQAKKELLVSVCSTLCCTKHVQYIGSCTGLAQSCSSSTGFIQDHRVHRNPMKRFPVIPLPQQRAMATPATTSRPHTALPPPVQRGGKAWAPTCTPVPPSGTAQQTHSHRGALTRSAQLGAKVLGHLQHLGRAKTHGALKRCRRPPCLRRQKDQEAQFYRRGSSKSLTCRQPLSLGNLQTHVLAEFVLFLAKKPPAPGLTAGAPLLHSLLCA